MIVSPSEPEYEWVQDLTHYAGGFWKKKSTSPAPADPQPIQPTRPEQSENKFDKIKKMFR